METLRSVFKAIVLSLAITLGCAMTGGAQVLSVDQVLDRWAQALGGREKLAAQKSIHTLLQVKTSGLTGTMDDYWSIDGRSAYYLSLANGAVKISGGCAADACWQKDMNGQIRPLAGADLQGANTGKYLANCAQFFPDRAAGQVTLIKSNKPSEVAVLIAPEGGQAVTYFLDKKTYLPIRSESQADDRVQTTWYRDWRSVDGMQVSFQVQQGFGDTLRDMFLSVQQVESNTVIPDSLLAAPTNRVRDYTFAKGTEARDIPFELVNNHIYVPVQVNGSRKLWFIFDSGAEMSCINDRVAKELGVNTSGDLEGRGVGEKSVSVALAQGLTYELPGVTVANQIAAVIPFAQLEPIEGRAIDGVLGYDFLSRFVVEIRYDRNSISLYEPSTFAYHGQAAPISFELEGSLPIVPLEVTVAGCPPLKGRFLMDTGMRSAISISSPTVRANNLMACVTKSIEVQRYGGVGGQSKANVSRASSVVIGGQTIKNLVVELSLDTLGAAASTQQNGSFGGEILRRFAVTFDYRKHELYLEPNGNLSDPDEYTMVGLQLGLGENMKDEIRIMSVIPTSPADKAGLQVGDIIQSLDGKALAGLKLREVYDLLKGEPKTKVKVTFLRGTVAKNTTVTLARLI